MALVKDKKKGENKDIFEIVAVDSGYGRLLALLLVVISRLKRKKKSRGSLHATRFIKFFWKENRVLIIKVARKSIPLPVSPQPDSIERLAVVVVVVVCFSPVERHF
jgi:hypothetical protein